MIRTTIIRRLRDGLCLLLATTALPALAAQPRRPRRPAAVLEDYGQALGGPRAFSRHKTIRLKREVEAKGMQIRGIEERWATWKGKSLSVTTISGLGTFRQGSDGKTRWSDDPINGLRFLSGAEDEEARIDSAWNADLRMRAFYRKTRTVDPPLPPEPDQRLECVELTPRLSRPVVSCFDADTHLRVYQQGVHATPQGEVPYTLKLSDWREVNGMKMAFVEEMTAGALTLVSRVLEVKVDEELDPKLFALPRPGESAPAGAGADPASSAAPGSP